MGSVPKRFSAPGASHRERTGEVGKVQATVDARTPDELVNEAGIETVSRTNRIDRRCG